MPRFDGSEYNFLVGKSMLPTIETGFKVKSIPVRHQEIRVGDIVIIKNKIQYICHRVIGKFSIGKEIYFLEKGDNLTSLRCLPADKIVSKVIEVETLDKVILTSNHFKIPAHKLIKYKALSVFYSLAQRLKLLLFGKNYNRFVSWLKPRFIKICGFLC
ncbi:S26 family signal peptidase [bacterium]|nr:MAG: S26 family signal peptidase [bacterium]